ncbi:MAG: pentapeptide repeat-containing protein [Acidimicrobiales bacterium]
MAKPRSALLGPRVPPDLGTDLPPLEDDSDWTRLLVQTDLSTRVAHGIALTECRVVGTALTGAHLDMARITDVVFEHCDLSGVSLLEASVQRVEFVGCRMLGVVASQAKLKDVRFLECRLDAAEFRLCTGDRVHFEDCTLRDADFYGMRLTGLLAYDCDLTGVELSRSELGGARLHGSVVERLRGVSYLRNVTIDSSQVLPLALQILPAVGITADDEREQAD